MIKILIYLDSLNASGGIERIVYELIKQWKVDYNVQVLVKDKGMCFYGQLNDIEVKTLDNYIEKNMKKRWQRIFTTLINTLTSIIKINNILKNDYDY